MSEIERRRDYTSQRLRTFREALEAHLGSDGRAALGDDTCIYVTGSGGRREMGQRSDLDLFIVRNGKAPSRLDALLVQAAILRASRECGVGDPSHDGAFLDPHAATDFLRLLGGPEDDAENKFTPRMLLLLESRALVGEASYQALKTSVLERYWEMAQGHSRPFLPFMLVNDIIRYWRVVLLNHESRLEAKKPHLSPDALRLERRVRSYKLRFARCLTCFATIGHVLGVVAKTDHLPLEAALAMTDLSPLERLEAIPENHPAAAPHVDRLRELYAGYLATTEGGKDDLRAAFQDPETGKQRSRAARAFADTIFTLLTTVGGDHTLFRYCVV